MLISSVAQSAMIILMLGLSAWREYLWFLERKQWMERLFSEREEAVTEPLPSSGTHKSRPHAGQRLLQKWRNPFELYPK